MAEIKEILTRTIVTVVDTILDIYTYFEAEIEEFLGFFIRDTNSIINDTAFAEGELGYSIQGLPNASFRVNDSGEFIANDLDADPYSIDNVGELIYDDSLTAPVATAASNILESSFIANWNIVTGAIKYYLDVSEDSQFNTYITGYQNLDVENVLIYEVSGLSGGTYYYRIRACNGVQVSLDSNVESLVTIESIFVAESFIPALIRNSEGNNIVASGTTTLLEITDVTDNTLTLNALPENLIDISIDWFVQGDSYNAGQPSYDGDYLVQDKITNFDFINKKITLISVTGFNVGDNICIYSPWANYEFLPGQESAGIVSKDVGVLWRSFYATSGPSWYDETLGRYVVLVNGRSTTGHNQVGFAYSTDLITWIIGNSDIPIILNSDNVNFTTHVIAEGNVVDVGGGRVAFCVPGYNGTNRYCHIVQMDKDCTNIVISDSLLPGATWYASGLAYYKGKYVIVTMKSNVGALETWTVEMWESTTIDSGYSKTCDVFTTEYDANDSVWLEGHADSLCPFVEDGKLYCLAAGTQRYTISMIQGNRVIGLLVYDDVTTWSIVNNFAPEIIFPMYFYNIPSEDYGWAGGHIGGYTSFIKRIGKCYLFCSFSYTANSYQVACLELINRV